MVSGGGVDVPCELFDHKGLIAQELEAYLSDDHLKMSTYLKKGETRHYLCVVEGVNTREDLALQKLQGSSASSRDV